MKSYKITTSILLSLLTILLLSCTNDETHQASAILDDPLYFAYDGMMQSSSKFSTKDPEKFQQIRAILHSCEVDGEDVCTILYKECIRENEYAVEYYQHHCRMRELQEEIMTKYSLSKSAFKKLYKQDLKARMEAYTFSS